MACSDYLAMGAMDCLELRGPERFRGDVAVTGYDDVAAGSGLTSVRQDLDLAGQVLARKMLDLVAGRPVASETLPIELIVRASTQA